ncbi:MAG TPA: glycerophosphodiester phosphodiesterase family protein, partial [Pseudoxanthomonas sp.]|nr:glycerophosphodiester phosphodiesterase family protein [Pseudoxanthomonas sp.]
MVIAHRGASALRPEHTLEAYRKALEDGADAIEPDLVMDLVAEYARSSGREIALVPELKHPTHFRTLGLGMEDELLKAIRAHPHFRKAPVLIQSFETGNLRALRGRLGESDRNIRLLQLFGEESDMPYDGVLAGTTTTYGDMATADGLATVARYANAIGVHSGSVVVRSDADGRSSSALVEAAHSVRLAVFVYTFRPENLFLAPAFRNDGPPEARNQAGSIAEIRHYLKAGIDGFFGDDP